LLGDKGERKLDFVVSFELAFDRDAPEFVQGVEVGVLYERLRSGVRPVESTVHAANAEMVLRLADAFDCPVRSEELGDEWLAVVFG